MLARVGLLSHKHEVGTIVTANACTAGYHYDCPCQCVCLVVYICLIGM